MDDLHDFLKQQIPRMRSYAYMLANSATDAEDLVQECLSRALHHTDNLLRAKNIRPYLIVMLRNLHIDTMKKNNRSRWDIPLDDLPRPIAIPPAQEDRLKIRDLEYALRLLPREQRYVVLMVGFVGMSYQDVAASLDIPVGTVMSRLSRGRHALRAMMGERCRKRPDLDVRGCQRRPTMDAHGVKAKDVSGVM